MHFHLISKLQLCQVSSTRTLYTPAILLRFISLRVHLADDEIANATHSKANIPAILKHTQQLSAKKKNNEKNWIKKRKVGNSANYARLAIVAAARSVVGISNFRTCIPKPKIENCYTARRLAAVCMYVYVCVGVWGCGFECCWAMAEMRNSMRLKITIYQSATISNNVFLECSKI